MNVSCCVQKNPPVDYMKEIISLLNLLLCFLHMHYPGVSWRSLLYSLINLVNKYYNKMPSNVIFPPMHIYPYFEEYDTKCNEL